MLGRTANIVNFRPWWWKKAIWFHTYHPNHPGGLYHEQRRKWVLSGLMGEAASELLSP